MKLDLVEFRCDHGHIYKAAVPNQGFPPPPCPICHAPEDGLEVAIRLRAARTPEERERELRTTLENIKIMADVFVVEKPTYSDKAVLQTISNIAERALS